MEERLHQLAFHDTLTQLPNRRLLLDHLALAIASCRRTGRRAALMFLDLDNFKSVNDRAGHAVGDLLLVEVARRLKSCVRETDTVARFGGDEKRLAFAETAHLIAFARGADGGWGALELGLRYSTFDGSDFSNSNPLHTGRIGATLPVTTSTTGAKAITAQLKWIPNIFTRFWLDWVHTDFDSPIVVNGVTESQENALVLRGQIDF